MINAIPIGGQAIQVAFGTLYKIFNDYVTYLERMSLIVWIWAWLSDWLHTRYWLIIAQAVIGLIPCIIMSIWNVPDSAKYAVSPPIML